MPSRATSAAVASVLSAVFADLASGALTKESHADLPAFLAKYGVSRLLYSDDDDDDDASSSSSSSSVTEEEEASKETKKRTRV